MILVACATAQEIARLERRSGIELLITGVGPIEAAARVGEALARRSYELVVNAGIAGAYDRKVRIGEGVAVSDERLELDLETGAPLELPAGVAVADRAASDPTLVARLAEAGFRRVRGVTVTRVTATDATAVRLRALGAEVESMEGFAVLRAAQIAGVAAIEVRGISNYAGERSRSEWSFTAGVDGLTRILNALLC